MRFAIALVLFSAAWLCAQETPSQEFSLTWTVAPRIERLDIGSGLLYLVGGVDVRINQVRVRCDTLVAWLATPDAAGTKPAPLASAASHAVREIYAEGTVLLFEGEEFTRAERLWLDLLKGRGLVVDAVRSFSVPLLAPADPVKLLLRADELRLLSPDRIVGLGVSATTCTFGHPHWHLASDRLELVRDAADPAVDGALRNLHVESSGNAFVLGGFGSVPLPDFSADSIADGDGLLGPIERLRFGSSGQFGWNPGVTLGHVLRRDGHPLARIHVPLDLYTERGVAIGLDAEYADPDGEFRGRLIARWQHDRGTDFNYGAPASEDRGRVSLFHRQELAAQLQVDVEVNAFSDRGYYPTWFETQFKTDKPPENLVYLKRSFENSWLTALFSHRFNGFVDTAVFEPQLRWDLVAEPLAEVAGRTLLLSVTAEAASVRHLTDSASATTWPSLTRTDIDAVVELSQPLGPFTVTPFAGVRWSTFSNDRNGQSVDRLGLLSGLRLQLEAWRDYFDVAQSLGLDGLRHTIQPALILRNVSGVAVDPATLVPVDGVENYSDVTEIELEVRNLLTTLRGRGRNPVNLLDVAAALAWYPDEQRSPSGSAWGPLRFDALLRPYEALELALDGDVDTGAGGGDLLNAALGWKPSDKLRLAGGWRHFSGVDLQPDSAFDMVFAQADWRVDEKWLIALQTSYEMRQSSGLRYAVGLSRIGHDFILRGTVYADPLEGEFGFALSLQPRLGFRGTRGFGEVGGEPRFDLFGQR